MKNKPNFLIEFEAYLKDYDPNEVYVIRKHGTKHPGESMEILRKKYTAEKKYRAYKEFADKIFAALAGASREDWIENGYVEVEYDYSNGLDKHMVVMVHGV